MVEHQSALLAGFTAMPTQLRMPAAKTWPPLPCGSNASTSARFSSLPQAAPSAWSGCPGLRSPPATSSASPRRRCWPSRPRRTSSCRRREKAMSRVPWSPPLAGERWDERLGRRRGPSGRRCGRESAPRSWCWRRRPTAGWGPAGRRRCRTAGRGPRRRSRSGAAWRRRPAARSTAIRPAPALGDEDVAVRRDAHQARASSLANGATVNPGRIFSSAPAGRGTCCESATLSGGARAAGRPG